MPRQILGTNKFIVHFFNAKMVRGGQAKPKHYAYKQWGRIWEVDRNDKKIGRGLPFTDYGEMIHFINKIMKKKVRENLKVHRTWD